MNYNLWDSDRQMMAEGETSGPHGLVSLASLIQRRWGWPRAASKSAAEYLKGVGTPFIMVNSGGFERRHESSVKMLSQQIHIIHAVPHLAGEICTGLVSRVFQDTESADHVLDCMVIQLDNPITEDGLVRGIVNELAVRLQIPSPQVRSLIEVDRETERGIVSLRVKNRVDE